MIRKLLLYSMIFLQVIGFFLELAEDLGVETRVWLWAWCLVETAGD